MTSLTTTQTLPNASRILKQSCIYLVNLFLISMSTHSHTHTAAYSAAFSMQEWDLVNTGDSGWIWDVKSPLQRLMETAVLFYSSEFGPSSACTVHREWRYKKISKVPLKKCKAVKREYFPSFIMQNRVLGGSPTRM